jgi:hypothetical protein
VGQIRSRWLFSGDLGLLLVLREANAVCAEAAISATRSFYPQLVFPPRTINNFQRHPCHEVVVITVCFGPEKAGVGGSTPSLATIILKNLAETWRQETGKITHGRSPTPTG